MPAPRSKQILHHRPQIWGPVPAHPGWSLPRPRANINNFHKSIIAPWRCLCWQRLLPSRKWQQLGAGIYFSSPKKLCAKSKPGCNSFALKPPSETSDKSALKGLRKGAGSELCSNFLLFMCLRVFRQSPAEKCEFQI